MNKKGAKYLLLIGFHPKNRPAGPARPADLPGPARPAEVGGPAQAGTARAAPCCIHYFLLEPAPKSAPTLSLDI